ncbi:uncharacterized protein F5147DRAFT_657128 [Suillus discolor]|uniref:Uncharacterized protein n=1 Tax=Suillus discolor TaxID=1912936 RepID=A0A9P7EXY5_9AGAM|nr:uncharacterized protein F5147DRAFT_657128 [Suillus discolor]KAG2094657.1 hypothetical protein F5147DRAFT_657128 [Suillus discolor]
MPSPDEKKELSKSSTYHTGTDKDKVEGKGKHPHLQYIGSPLLPFTLIATHFKTTRKSKTNMKAQHPSPISEEPDIDIEMVDDACALTSTGLPDTAPDAVPAVSADDFPVD